MKLAFTTLGCPAWDMETIISKAVEYGFDGVDFRGYLGELKLYELPEFTKDIQITADRFADAGLMVPCFSSSVRAFSKTQDKLDSSIREIRSYAEICQQFETPYIRIFGGAIGDTSRSEAINITAGNLFSLLTVAEEYDVKLLIETHDDWIDSSYLSSVIDMVDSDTLGVLWDTHHPYRMIGEPPEKTWENLGRWICNTHWKDSSVNRGGNCGYKLCLPGDGDIPLTEIYIILADNNFDGYLTFEWEKMWTPEIEEPEIAFPKYVQYMRKLMEEL